MDLVNGNIVHKEVPLLLFEIILGYLPFVALVEANELIVIHQVGFIEIILLIAAGILVITLLLGLKI